MPVVAHSVSPFLFPTGSWVYTQLTSLRRYEALVVCRRRKNRADYPFERVHSLDDFNVLRQQWQRLRKAVEGAYPFMVRACRESQARLLHSHFAFQGWQDLGLARRCGLRHATSFYGADIWRYSRQELWRQRYRTLFAQGDRFFVEGNAMKRKVVELGCDPEKVTIQHLGVDVDKAAFRERRKDADGLVRVLASGRAVEKKGLEFGLRAFDRARRELPNLRLHLMLIAKNDAEKALLERVRTLVRELDLEGCVEFPPPRPYEEYRRALYDYHVFFAPSLHASDGDAEGGAPVSILDMSATGMPIVGSDHCDIPEVAPHGVSGAIFREQDLDAAAQALLDVAGSPERWAEWGRAGRAHVEREYSLGRQFARLEELYDELIGGST